METRDVFKHPPKHRIATKQRNVWPQMSTMAMLRNIVSDENLPWGQKLIRLPPQRLPQQNPGLSLGLHTELSPDVDPPTLLSTSLALRVPNVC